jgi:hypothetical protein
MRQRRNYKTSTGASSRRTATPLSVIACLVAFASLAASAIASERPNFDGPNGRAAMRRAELEQAAAKAKRQTPQAKQERVASRTAHRGESNAAALATARAAFPSTVAEPPQTGFKLDSGQQIDRYLNDFQALVSLGNGRSARVSSAMPLRTRVGGQLVPVDLSLQAVDGGFSPVAPIVASSFASHLSGGLSVGDIRMTLL